MWQNAASRDALIRRQAFQVDICWKLSTGILVSCASTCHAANGCRALFRWWSGAGFRIVGIIVVVLSIFKFMLMSTFFLRKQCHAVSLCPKCHIPPVSLHPYESSSISSAANPVVLMDPPPISTCPENPAWKSSSVSTNKREAFPLVSYQGIERQPVESTVSNLPAKDKGCHKEVISSIA